MHAARLVALITVCACTSDREAPAPTTKAHANETSPSETQVLPPVPRSPKVKRQSELGKPLVWNTDPPALDAQVTGVATKDPHASELERCKRTSWSYSGCWVVYPLQGRVWTKFECEHVEDDDMRVLVCHNYAVALAVGRGGPPDSARGREILAAGCDVGELSDCATLAELLMWDDPARATPFVTKTCSADPAKVPAGFCADMDRARSKALHRYSVALSSATGLDGTTTSTACSLGVIDGDQDCRVRFACGDRVLYGATNGATPCKAGSAGPVGGETMTSADDDDPAIEFDAAAKTVHIYDSASATAPAFDLRGTLTAR